MPILMKIGNLISCHPTKDFYRYLDDLQQFDTSIQRGQRYASLLPLLLRQTFKFMTSTVNLFQWTNELSQAFKFRIDLLTRQLCPAFQWIHLQSHLIPETQKPLQPYLLPQSVQKQRQPHLLPLLVRKHPLADFISISISQQHPSLIIPPKMHISFALHAQCLF